MNFENDDTDQDFDEDFPPQSCSVRGRIDWIGFEAGAVSELESDRLRRVLRNEPGAAEEYTEWLAQTAWLRKQREEERSKPTPPGLAWQTFRRIAHAASRWRGRMTPVTAFGSGGVGTGGCAGLFDWLVAGAVIGLLVMLAIPMIRRARENAFWLRDQDRLRTTQQSQQIRSDLHHEGRSDHIPKLIDHVRGPQFDSGADFFRHDESNLFPIPEMAGRDRRSIPAGVMASADPKVPGAQTVLPRVGTRMSVFRLPQSIPDESLSMLPQGSVDPVSRVLVSVPVASPIPMNADASVVISSIPGRGISGVKGSHQLFVDGHSAFGVSLE